MQCDLVKQLAKWLREHIAYDIYFVGEIHLLALFYLTGQKYCQVRGVSSAIQ